MRNTNVENDTEALRAKANTEATVHNLSEQLRMAGLVQRDFLPRQLPECERLSWAITFLPAEYVSGDIYDIVRLDEEHIGFYIADVVGHGMPAALLTIFLKQALVMRQTFGNSYHIFSPVEVLDNANIRMTEQKLSGNQFATCCYCLLNVKTLELTYSRAGHPYPIMIKAGEEPCNLESKGSLLGIFEEGEFDQKTIQLETGDKLILYSDGAENFIGSVNDESKFSFAPELCDTKDLPILKINKKFTELASKEPTDPQGKDDITIIGLEIL